MTARRWPLASLLLTALGAAACAPDEPAPDDRIGLASDSIQGGYLDETDKAVVGIYMNNMQSLCSGSLLAPNVVLTAHHCVANSPEQISCGSATFGSPWAPGNFFVTTYTDTGFQNYFTLFPLQLPKWHAVREVVVPPGGNSVCGFDQALLILADPVDASEAAPLVPAVDVPLVANQEYRAIGFGLTYDSQNAPVGRRYRRDGLFTECVGAECPGMYQVGDQEFEGDTGVCQGDSGGPAIDLLNRVVGVASRGGAGCTYPTYGHVFSWGQWIKDTTVYAAGLAATTPPPWATGYPTDPIYSAPIGAACAQPAECPGATCLDGYCSRPCNVAAPCPDGYECTADGSVCRAVPPPPPAEPQEIITTEEWTCTVRAPASNPDPTKPVPWNMLLGAGVAALLWRRRARG
ncbi:MAG: trypsin-like serine protease [Polyangiaceae bacterium]|nr:trypsin-like serine protease [Polyangiaceae bacterium]